MFTVFTNPFLRQHQPPGPHPENPTRTSVIEKRLETETIEGLNVAYPDRLATYEELRLAHSPEHIDRIFQTAQQNHTQLDADTYACQASAQAARMACGLLLHSVDQILTNQSNRILSLTRPPGHHATKDGPMGFCLINNIAVAAAYALTQSTVKRVAIFDFDVHHGNGTQDIFYENPDVLYLSCHQYPFYPGSGDWKELGSGRAKGTTINCPLSKGSGDQELWFLWDYIFQKILIDFAPDLLMISTGFDAHQDDPLGGLNVSDRGFEMLFHRLEKWAKEQTISLLYTLEGGYSAYVLDRCVMKLCQAHLSPKEPISVDSNERCQELADTAKRYFSPFWAI